MQKKTQTQGITEFSVLDTAVDNLRVETKCMLIALQKDVDEIVENKFNKIKVQLFIWLTILQCFCLLGIIFLT